MKLAGHSEPIPLLGATAEGSVQHNLKATLLIANGQAVIPTPGALDVTPRIAGFAGMWRSPGSFVDGDTIELHVVPGSRLSIVRFGPPLPPMSGGGLV